MVKGRGGLRFLRRGGPPAGLFHDTRFERESLQLHTGDACLMVTDGVTEALDGDRVLEQMLTGYQDGRGRGTPHGCATR